MVDQHAETVQVTVAKYAEEMDATQLMHEQVVKELTIQIETLEEKIR